jgi:hypothetical protein
MTLSEQLDNERTKCDQLERDNQAFNEEVKRLADRLSEEINRREKAEAAKNARPRRSSVLEESNV